MDNRFETSTLEVHSPRIAPNAKYVRHVNFRFRLPAKAFKVCLGVQASLRRIVRDAHGAADGDERESLIRSRRIAYRPSEIEKSVTEIVSLAEPGFASKVDRYGRIVELTEYGVGRFYHDEHFVMGKIIDSDRGHTLDRYRVRPKVQLFLDVYERHPISKYGPQYFAAHPACRTPDGKQFLWESYNELIEMIRAEAKVRGLDKQDIANAFRSTRAFKSMLKVVNQCFTVRRRIFVNCIDVFYRVERAEQVSIDLAKSHHADFVNRLRGLAEIRKSLVGAIWKLDWSETKGHYFRWVFMFDGDDVHATWKYEELVDDLWKSIVPKKAGGVLVLNDEADMKVATGMIDLDENPKKFGIFVESVIRYLACKDQFLCVKRKPGTRTWDWLILRGKCAETAEAVQVDDPPATSDSTS
ncbi:hypothetical protein [Burkholderia gladioli]|uniref:hypothetical protein n=1 Tax=Burkholderia gladioli TaxID=28095 RepID=UPI0034DAD5E2